MSKSVLALLILLVSIRALPVGPPLHSSPLSTAPGRPRVPTVVPPTPDEFAAALRDLDSDTFDTRKAAEDNLHRWTAGRALTPANLATLNALLANPPSPEVRARVRRVVVHARAIYPVPQSTIATIVRLLDAFEEKNSDKGFARYIELNTQDRQRVIESLLTKVVKSEESGAARTLVKRILLLQNEQNVGPYDDDLDYLQTRANVLFAGHPGNLSLAELAGRKEFLKLGRGMKPIMRGAAVKPVIPRLMPDAWPRNVPLGNEK